MILYINACVRKNSRTNRLAHALLDKLGDYTELKLCELNLQPLLENTLEKRTELVRLGAFDDGMFALAKQFASADTVVMSAPLWDSSFPTLLKTYIENVCVMGICSEYLADGTPHGLCKAQKLYYVSTSGGPYVPDFGYKQIEALAKNYFGIPETRLIAAENLDIFGNDVESILKNAIDRIEANL